MSNYKKFTLDTIKQKLKNGEYEAPVGAMRAIGKTQELSEGDKEKARIMVRKHFGVEEAAPKPKAKKAAKKAAAKKGSKKAAKKATAKPKAARAKKAAKPAAAAAPKKAVAKKATKKTKRSKPAVSTEGDNGASTSEAVARLEVATNDEPQVKSDRDRPALKGNVVLEMGQVISTTAEALKAMEIAKRLFPKAKLEHDVNVATGAMARAVKIIDQEIMAPRLNEGEPTPAAAPAGRKKGSKKGTRAKASPPAPTEPPANGAHNEGDLSEEEQEQLRLARATQTNPEG